MASVPAEISERQTLKQRRAAFAEQVREALAHLYDLPFLQTHPLARVAAGAEGSSPLNLGKTLRQALLEAIESLHPDPKVRAPRAALTHRLLTLRYVDGNEIEAVAGELGISRSEYFREQRQALAAVSALLWETWRLGAEDVQLQTLEGGEARLRSTEPSATRSPSEASLPLPLTSFVGREREQREVMRLLSRLTGASRLLTLLGAGGCGKSRLALEVARQLASDFADGVWLIELALLADSTLIEPAIARAVGVRGSAHEPLRGTLSRFFADKRALLLLDNCEHLVDACARIVEDLLRRCAQLRILATSREPLHVAGEVNWRVPSLDLPASATNLPPDQLARYDAIRLFVDRAQAAQPDFDLNDRTARSVAEICRRLDGIPLAIELAAARATVLTVQQIADRLDDRFSLLSRGTRTAVPRQQTLRASLDWSYDLLTDAERALFRRVSVFVGSFALDAAEVICGRAGALAIDVVEQLDSLAGKSLVQVRDGREEPTFLLLETIREYARERLNESGEAETLREAHAAYFLRLAEEAEPHFERSDRPIWVRQIVLAIDNLRAAFAYFLRSGDAERSLRLSALLIHFSYDVGNLAETLGLIATALALPQETVSPRTRAWSRMAAAGSAWIQTNYQAAENHAIEAAHLYRALGDLDRLTWTLCHLGNSRNNMGDYAGARVAFEEALEIQRHHENPAELARALAYCADSATDAEDIAAARAYLADGLAPARRTGNLGLIAWNRWNEGRIAALQNDWTVAVRAFADSYAIARDNASMSAVADGAYGLGYIACRLRDLPEARRQIAEGLAIARESGQPHHIHYGLDHAAVLAVASSDPVRAARLAGASTASRERHRSIRHPIWKTLLRRAGVPIERPADDARLGAAWDQGLALSLDEALADAMTEDL